MKFRNVTASNKNSHIQSQSDFWPLHKEYCSWTCCQNRKISWHKMQYLMFAMYDWTMSEAQENGCAIENCCSFYKDTWFVFGTWKNGTLTIVNQKIATVCIQKTEHKSTYTRKMTNKMNIKTTKNGKINGKLKAKNFCNENCTMYAKSSSFFFSAASACFYVQSLILVSFLLFENENNTKISVL